jgi:hypothetical protein
MADPFLNSTMFRSFHVLYMAHGHGHGHGEFITTRVTEKFTPFPRRVPAVTPTCLELPYMKCA